MPRAYTCQGCSLMYLTSIGDSDDALGRMLAVVRFWFTKDLVGIWAQESMQI